MFILFAQVPIVMMHGAGLDASSLNDMKMWIEQKIQGVAIVNCEVGNGVQDSLNMSLTAQTKLLTDCIMGNPVLANGFIGVGHSQGTLLLRGYLSAGKGPKMIRYISIAGPQGGFYCFGNSGDSICDTSSPVGLIQASFTKMTQYTEAVQNKNGIANFWKDPTDLSTYRTGCQFMPDINQQRAAKNPLVKAAFESLDLVVLFGSFLDGAVKPFQSLFFGFYADGSTTDIVDMTEQDYYKQDWFGLKTMNEAGKVLRLESGLPHVGYLSSEGWVKNQLVPMLIVGDSNSTLQTSVGSIAAIVVLAVVVAALFITLLVIIIKYKRAASINK
ncbi:Palmitoyl-protein thioesterase [Spironucleus salmonicida]|uniref:Palmitoyl-protein thioesterase 1 n=1 Tax=Spironucleus salmonicida TaxID=348837 RepID=V6LS95_9EUKA|nr:Palmitoyl-protein thioesterase [Spironucleus salmonicida]|eukprot:EST47128.1 Palmitoyl-protein thioesterase [Spironucleus salmonicida]